MLRLGFEDKFNPQRSYDTTSFLRKENIDRESHGCEFPYLYATYDR